jgi:two-component system, LytTR family, sensor kinase
MEHETKGASGARPIVRPLTVVATALGLWAALALLFAAPFVLTGPVSWGRAVSFGGGFWVLWLIFIPAVAWLAFRFPIERNRLFQKLGLHLLACLLTVGASQMAFRAAARFIPHPQREPAPGRTPEAPGAESAPPDPFEVLLGFRAALDILAYWSLVGLCQAITNFRRSEQRERRAAELEARLTRSKLQALRMQVNPHFLFNTLNAISTLIYVNPRAADEMIGDLSELLRRSLATMEEQETSLAQELDFIRAYISIEQKRFGDRLRLEHRVPEDLKNAVIPALLLQPLVENAIRHGIEPQRSPGIITIEARQEGKHLRLIVQDDGKGILAKNWNGQPQRGIGLANTKARLEGLYGQDQQFSFGAAEPHGCRVEIRLPLHTEPMQVATPSARVAP